MQILKFTLQELTEKDRRALVLHLVDKLGVHEVTIYRWAKGDSKPSHPLVMQQLIDEINEWLKVNELN